MESTVEAVPHDRLALVQENLVADVLAIVVECSNAVDDAKSLCTLLQLNNTCCKALQRCRGQQRIIFKATHVSATAFAKWLRKHAGLVAEVHFECPSNGQNSDSEQATGSALSTAVLQCSTVAAAAAGAGSILAPPTAAGRAPGAMQLLLHGLRSCVYVPPALLQGLAGSTGLTRLELMCCRWVTWGTDIAAAMQQLSNLKSLTMLMGDRCPYEEEDLDWGRYACKALGPLSKLTRLDMGPLVSADASSFPTTLIELQLEVVASVRMEEPPSPPSPSEDFESSAEELDYEYDWREGWKWEHMGASRDVRQAALLLDLKNLPLLQRCNLERSLMVMDMEESVPTREVLEVQLAAPHLTRLQLIGEFGNLPGLQDCCAHMQVLGLSGCVTATSRLASLLSCMPDLRSFVLDGLEHLCHSDEWDTRPVVKTTPQEERQLAAALGAATKLTKLCVDGLGPRGHDGPWDLEPVASVDDDDTRYGPWGQFLPNLKQLQTLVVQVDSPLYASDAMRLTGLTALTKLRFDSESDQRIPADTLAQLKEYLTQLQVLNPTMIHGEWDW